MMSVLRHKHNFLERLRNVTAHATLIRVYILLRFMVVFDVLSKQLEQTWNIVIFSPQKPLQFTLQVKRQFMSYHEKESVVFGYLMLLIRLSYFIWILLTTWLRRKWLLLDFIWNFTNMRRGWRSYKQYLQTESFYVKTKMISKRNNNLPISIGKLKRFCNGRR